MRHKIALVIHALHGGGAERLMSQLATRWSEQHDVHLVTWSSPDSDRYSISDQVQRHSLGLLRESRHFVDAMVSNVRRIKCLRSKLQELKPDLILSFCDRTNIVALQASRRLAAARWISEHSNPAEQHLGSLWEKWRQKTYRSCDGCTVLTQDIAEWMSTIVPADCIRVIPPSISVPKLAEQDSANESREERAELGATTLPENLTAHRKRLLFVGRLSAEKRIDRLISAWSQIESRLPDWELVIVGNGPEEESLRKSARNGSRIVMAGWCDEPDIYYRVADLFALPSDYEGFPVALLEAMAHGLPCISTNCTRALDEINHPETCVTVVERDEGESLATAILGLAKDDEERAQKKVISQERAAQYSWESIGPMWDQILESIS